MSEPACDPQTFYSERVPAQFNRTLEAQEAAAAQAGDEASKRIVAAMKQVNATICISVTGELEGQWYLNIRGGCMSASDSADKPPFMSLLHDLDSFRVLERESGDSVLGFLGAIAGLKEDMKLTSQRIQNLHGIDGSLRFQLTGENALELTAHFGAGPLPEQPSCSISVDGAAYQELRTGKLEPQDAFMSGKIQAGGDMQMAMQIALAALSPE